MAGFRFEGEGAFGGATSGAAIGTSINPGLGTAIGAGIGAIAGGFLGGSGRQQAPQFDIASLMAQINERIFQAGELAKVQVRQRAAARRGATASNLASRGILRSSVSQATFGRVEDQASLEELAVDQQVLQQQASTSASLLGQGAQLQSQQARADAQAANQRRAAQFGQLGAISSAILQNRLQAAKGASGTSLNRTQGLSPMQQHRSGVDLNFIMSDAGTQSASDSFDSRFFRLPDTTPPRNRAGLPARQEFF